VTKRMTYLASIAILTMSAFAASSAQAKYLVTFSEVGSDVVESGSGTINPGAFTTVVVEENSALIVPGSAFFSPAPQAWRHSCFRAHRAA
jgi:hypothetical protein